MSADGSNLTGKDKLVILKSQLQKEKELMKKTGKRFRQNTAMSTKQSNSENSIKNNILPQKHEISIGPEMVVKQVISLKDISVDSSEKVDSRIKQNGIFEKQMQHQKKLSKQLHNFLTELELQSFAEVLIQNGFQDLQTLANVNTQDLNMVMMRAPQQIKLLEGIKNLKLSPRQKPNNQVLEQEFPHLSRNWRVKTEPMQERKPQRTQSFHIINKMKSSSYKQQKQSNGLKPGSFLYSVGGKNWSVEDQTRRACSTCFKIQQQMEKKGDCYYCSKCIGNTDKLFQVEIDQNMNRLYKRLDQQ